MGKGDDKRQHLTVEECELLADLGLAPAEGWVLPAYLTRLCRALLARWAWPPAGSEAAPQAADLDPYDFPVARALAAARPLARAFAGSRRRARRELAELLAECGRGPLPLERLRPAARSSLAARWAWCEALIEAAAEPRGLDPIEALKLAEQAVEQAEKLARERFPARALADLTGHARMEYANLLRVNEDLGGSLRAFVVAVQKRARTGDLRLWARLRGLGGSVLRARRMFPEALAALADAERAYLKLGNWHRAARVLVKRGATLIVAGRPEEAVETLLRALPGIDHESEPVLRLAAEHNLLLALV